VSAESARRWPPWTRVLVGVLAAIGVFYIAMLVMFSTIGCMSTDSAIVPSPSGAFVAYIKERECRGRPPQTGIWVGRADSHTFGSVFLADAKPDDNGGFTKVAVRIAWSDADELQVYYPWALSFQSRVDDAEGVKVAYHEVSPRQ
jgi:hypothetical protein